MAIEVKVWRMDVSSFGEFVAEIQAPLGIGTLRIADGHCVKGFICEPAGIDGADDITAFGGWRKYLASIH